MMRIDAFNHFFPKKYFERLLAAGLPDLGKRMAELPAVHDIDHRRRIVGSFRDYKQVISLAAPSLEALSKGDPDLAVELPGSATMAWPSCARNIRMSSAASLRRPR
jgi:hypothetical protein